jgi:hypothetical protein
MRLIGDRPAQIEQFYRALNSQVRGIVIRFRLLTLFVILLPVPRCSSESAHISANEIMARVAANQELGLELRRQFMYRQTIDVQVRSQNGKLLRREDSRYLALPSATGTTKKLEMLSGRYLHKGAYVNFDHEPAPDSDTLDASLVRQYRGELMGSTKDGISTHLFPLTALKQKNYRFELLGEETVNGRRAYRVAFEPLNKSDVDWRGEALIDATDFGPIRVFTQLSRRFPALARAMLGTDLPDMGFNVAYQRLEQGVWFPTSFGTEFSLKAVFFIRRQISLSMKNDNFQRTTTNSSIEYGTPVK